MNLSKFNYLVWSILISIPFFVSCNGDNPTPPVIFGSTVTVTNTFQSTAFTNGSEDPVEALFQVPEGSLAATATVSESVEFPAYLLNLYDIDIEESSISFTLVAEVDDPTYKDLFRTLEAGTIDRYYLTFDEAQNVAGFSSNNSSVNLRIDSDKILVIEIGEGFNFNPGTTFTISLD